MIVLIFLLTLSVISLTIFNESAKDSFTLLSTRTIEQNTSRIKWSGLVAFLALAALAAHLHFNGIPDFTG